VRGAAGTEVVPGWLVAAVAVARRAERVSIPVLSLQTAALSALGVAVAVGVRRASASVSPSYVATPVLLSVTPALDPKAAPQTRRGDTYAAQRRTLDLDG
jgi:hypothetical protein